MVPYYRMRVNSVPYPLVVPGVSNELTVTVYQVMNSTVILKFAPGSGQCDFKVVHCQRSYRKCLHFTWFVPLFGC